MFELAYLVLTLFTLAIVVGICALWLQTRSPHFALALFLVYYYSLAGAWKILDLKASGAPSESLDHLEASLFPIIIDENYALALTIYGIFNLAFIFVLCLVTVGRRRSASEQQILDLHECRFAHAGLLLLAILAFVGSFLLIWGAFVSALDSGTSVYSASRGEANQFFTIHQLLNRVGLDSLVIGTAACIFEKRRARWLFSYLLVIAVWGMFLGALGNRNELFVAAVAGVLLCYSFGIRFGVRRVVAMGFSAFIGLRVIEVTRGAELDGIFATLLDAITTVNFWNPLALATGSESFAAHMSMYGVLSQHLEYTNGSSLLYLVNSLLPRIVSADRIADTYSIYASAVGAPETQGFNIHYAAACYLNFGLIAVLLGAVVLATVWGALYRIQSRLMKAPARLRVSMLVAFCFCSAYVPVLMRGGPEGLKSLVVEGIALPFLLAHMALRLRSAAPSATSTFALR